MDEELLKKFLNDLTVEKGLSRNTLESYERDLRKYALFMRGKKADGIKQADVVSFLVHLAGEGIATPSAARSLAAIRGFPKYLITDGFAQNDAAVNIETPRGWKRLPKTRHGKALESPLTHT